MDIVWRMVSFAGLVSMVGMAYGMSTKRDAVRWKTVLWGIGLQLLFAVLILRTAPGEAFFQYIGRGVSGVLDCTRQGTLFVFGVLGSESASETAFGVNKGFFLAFQVLPIIVFVSSLSAVLYYLGILQTIVETMARVMKRVMGTSGAESLAAAANVFVGMVEAPLLVRPYVEKMTKSELFCLMTTGMATIAGNMLVIYAGPQMLGGVGVLGEAKAAGHLLAASVMSAPAAIAIAKLMIPETEKPITVDSVRVEMESGDVNVIDAACRGAVQGLKIAINVAAILIAFMAFVHLVNGVFGLFHTSLQEILGWVCAPLALLMGIPWKDAVQVGSMLGTKVVLNEFIAYRALVEGASALSPRSITIATYALCGFANLGSLGIMIAGVGAIAPSRRGDIARLGIKSIIAGSLAAFMTAAIAGILVG